MTVQECGGPENGHLCFPVVSAGALWVLLDQSLEGLQRRLRFSLRHSKNTHTQKDRGSQRKCIRRPQTSHFLPATHFLAKLLGGVQFRFDGLVQLVEQFGFFLLGWRTKRRREKDLDLFDKSTSLLLPFSLGFSAAVWSAVSMAKKDHIVLDLKRRLNGFANLTCANRPIKS